MLRKFLFFVFLIVPLVSFGQDIKLPTYTVGIWKVGFNDLAVIGPDKNVYMKNGNPGIEGTLGIEFNTKTLAFDLDRGLMIVNLADSYIVRLRNSGMLTESLMKFSEPTTLSLDLGGPAWNTVMVTETLDNGQVYSTWYGKVFDEGKRVWRWEVLSSARTK